MTASIFKATFHKIPKQKQDHIIRCALKEFAKCGFAGTNILDIAKRAQISVGSLYTYVDSKDELYLAVAQILVNKQIAEIEEYELADGFLPNIAKLFQVIQHKATTETDMVQFGFDMMTEIVAARLEHLTKPLEDARRELFVKIIDQAVAKQELKTDCDQEFLAYMLDNYLLTYQLALSTTFNKVKHKLYFGTSDPDELGQKMLHQFECCIAK